MKKKLSITSAYILVGIVPMVLVTIIISLITGFGAYNNLQDGAYSQLKSAAVGLKEYYQPLLASGDVTYDHSIVDSQKLDGVDLTLFIGDERYITSVLDANNPSGRNEGTKCDSSIYAELQRGNDYKDDNVTIAGQPYYVYYTPIVVDGVVAGSAFAGLPKVTVYSAINTNILNIIIAAVLLLIVCGAIVFVLGSKVAGSVKAAVHATNLIAEGDISSVEVSDSSKISDIEVLMKSLYATVSNISNIATSLNASTSSMNNIAAYLSSISTECKESVSNVAQAIDGVAKGSTYQAESTQQAQCAVVSIGTSIDEASSAKELLMSAVEEMGGLKVSAQEAMNSVLSMTSETSDSILDIQQQAQKTNECAAAISKAVDIITSIAEQTNLLSLNASIEAARAGEAGRGFSVVATEIRTLAEQSNNSASEIAEVVDSLSKQAQNTLSKATELSALAESQNKTVQATKCQFDDLGQALNRTKECSSTIVNSISEIDSAKGALIKMIEDLSAISEENAAIAEETTSSSILLQDRLLDLDSSVAELSSTAKTLSEIVAFFK